MAVSGSKNFSVTRTDIIYAAMRKVGAYDASDTPSSDESSHAVFALNSMVKGWSIHGIDVPWREKITVFIQPGTQSYRIGPTGDHAASSYAETTLSANAATSATTITLTSTAGITAADYIGIKLDSGVVHWTTVNVAATTTIITGLASAASSGNAVYAYTTKANRPQRLVYAYRTENDFDNEVELIGDIAYRGLSSKGQTGVVNQAFYQPTMTNGTLFVWPTSGTLLNLLAQPLVDDFDAASNNPQFPIEWTDALVYNLASRLAPEYGIPLKERGFLKAEATQFLEDLLDYDVENASVIFGLE